MIRKPSSMSRPLFAAAVLVSAVAGCGQDRPADYARQRPAVDQLDPRDRGLQSKDVVDASDSMAMSLLALPELNVSDRRWTVVVTGVRNQTTSSRQNLDIFIQRLRVNLARHGRDRVQLIANRDAYREIQSRELESERDDFGQGAGKPAPGPAGIQPDFGLEATATDLPNRGTDYYLFEFRLVDMRTRELVWTDAYEVRVAN
jgi:PBP1b-binding outer membrane lipoprotein LpoB